MIEPSLFCRRPEEAINIDSILQGRDRKMEKFIGKPTIVLIDAISFGLGLFSLLYLMHTVQLPQHLAEAGQWQFLTNLSLTCALVVFALGCIAHLLKSPALFQLKNSLHPIAMTLECVVTAIYWPLRLMFIQILVKDPNAKFIPIFIDICLHLVPFLALAIDYFFFMPKWTITPAASFVTCIFLSTLYWVWLKFLINFENGGEYPYEFLNVPDERIRIIIFGIVTLLAYGIFMLLRSFYDVVHRSNKPAQSKEKTL